MDRETAGALERQISGLLRETRKKAEVYASAQYRREGQEGRSGLAMRLEAFEEALLALARAIDEISLKAR